MRKLLFLDVDGVLNGFVDLWDEPPIGADKVARLKRIVDEFGCDVVLSSSWRVFSHLRRELVPVLSEAGIELVGDTPDLIRCSRGHEIKSWVDDEVADDPVCVVVLDDDVDARVEGVPSNWKYLFVNTSFKEGLTDLNVEEVLGFFRVSGRTLGDVCTME